MSDYPTPDRTSPDANERREQHAAEIALAEARRQLRDGDIRLAVPCLADALDAALARIVALEQRLPEPAPAQEPPTIVRTVTAFPGPSPGLKVSVGVSPDAALRAENARLREALEPFARMADIITGNKGEAPDEWHFSLKGAYAAITVGDCRRAAEALGQKP